MDLTFLENCERYTLRSLVRRSAKHHAEMTVDRAKRIFSPRRRTIQPGPTTRHDRDLQAGFLSASGDCPVRERRQA
jgi:hypothetical protein